MGFTYSAFLLASRGPDAVYVSHIPNQSLKNFNRNLWWTATTLVT